MLHIVGQCSDTGSQPNSLAQKDVTFLRCKKLPSTFTTLRDRIESPSPQLAAEKDARLRSNESSLTALPAALRLRRYSYLEIPSLSQQLLHSPLVNATLLP
jgi:hypothetical protein